MLCMLLHTRTQSRCNWWTTYLHKYITSILRLFGRLHLSPNMVGKYIWWKKILHILCSFFVGMLQIKINRPITCFSYDLMIWLGVTKLSERKVGIHMHSFTYLKKSNSYTTYLLLVVSCKLQERVAYRFN